MTELTPLETLVRDVLSASIEWYRADRDATDEAENTLFRAVGAFLHAQAPRALTWGQVPAGWEVQAPDGKWYRLDSTRQTPGHGAQIVGMLGGSFSRDPAGPVTARPGVPNPTDAALAALGFPEILEDRP